jgi:hypothetical protein
VVNKWYASGDYHKDHGEGLDGYSVAHNRVPTRGCGGLGIWDGTKLWTSINFKSQRVLATGPVRTVFELTYDQWDAAGRSVSEVKRMNIDANANFTRVESLLQADGSALLTVGVGIARRDGADQVAQDFKGGWLAYWEPEQGQNGNTACAVVLPGGVKEFTRDNVNLLAVSTVKPGRSFVYFLGAGWSKSGDFADAGAWFDYVKMFSAQQRAPLKVSVR